MKKYEFKNATIYVHGEVNKERLRRATINFIKQSRKYAKVKGGTQSTYGNSDTSRIVSKEKVLD